MCVHTCACARMRIYTFGNIPSTSIEVGRAGFGPLNIEKLPTPMFYTQLLPLTGPLTIIYHDRLNNNQRLTNK